MSTSEDFYYNEEDMQEIAYQIASVGDSYQEIFDKYLMNLRRLKMLGLSSGETSKALSVYIDCAEGLKEEFTMVSQNFRVSCLRMQADVDSADKYLF